MAKKTKADALKTRQHLIETAIAQFALRGVANTTLNDIADAADVTRGAIAALLYIAAVPRQQALMQILYHKCEFHNGMISEQAIREKMGFHHQSLLEVLQRCMDKKLISGSLDLDVILIILHGSFSGIVKNWLMIIY